MSKISEREPFEALADVCNACCDFVKGKKCDCKKCGVSALKELKEEKP